MADTSYRELRAAERKLIDRLLSSTFAGKDELVQQLERCLVKAIDENGSLEIQTQSPIKASLVKYRVPIEAKGTDSDGVSIHFLLHVVEGAVHGLEIFKENNSSIRSWPCADDIHVFAID